MLYMPEEPLSSKQEEYVDLILKSGKHLLELINEVLDLAKIESGTVELSPEPISLNQIVPECLSLIQPLAGARGITLETEGLKNGRAAVQSDYTRFKQSLVNLLSNAVKYNRPEGRVTVLCESIVPGRLRIGISDTGQGIAEDLLADLFQPFNRLGAEGGGIEGTGIGLALTKTLIELMDGHIEVESTPGEGSTFWLDMPAAAAPDSPTTTPNL